MLTFLPHCAGGSWGESRDLEEHIHTMRALWMEIAFKMLTGVSRFEFAPHLKVEFKILDWVVMVIFWGGDFAVFFFFPFSRRKKEGVYS